MPEIPEQASEVLPNLDSSQVLERANEDEVTEVRGPDAVIPLGSGDKAKMSLKKKRGQPWLNWRKAESANLVAECDAILFGEFIYHDGKYIFPYGPGTNNYVNPKLYVGKDGVTTVVLVPVNDDWKNSKSAVVNKVYNSSPLTEDEYKEYFGVNNGRP